LGDYEWPVGQSVVCDTGGSWSIAAECVAVGGPTQVGSAGTLRMRMTENSDFSLAWAMSYERYWVATAAMLLGVDSSYIRIQFFSLRRRVRARSLQESSFDVGVTQFGADKNASVLESHMTCALFSCVGGPEGLGVTDTSTALSTAIAAALAADGEAVPSGLNTAGASFVDFVYTGDFVYVAPESAPEIVSSAGTAFTGIAVGASVGGCCFLCWALTWVFVQKKRIAKANG